MRKNFRLDSAQAADARAALKILEGSGVSLEEAARIALHLEGDGNWKEIDIEQAVDAFLVDCRSRVKSGAMRPRTVEYYEENLWAFEAAHSGRLTDALTRKGLEQYFLGLGVSAVSRDTHFRAVRAWLNWCARQDPALVRKNPLQGLRLPKIVKETEIGFLSVEDAAAALTARTPHRWAIALHLFAGIRPEEIASRHKPGLDWRHVNRKERIIRIPGEMAKGSRRGSMARLIDGVPPTLWRWIKDAPAEGIIFPWQPGQIRAAAKRAAGFGPGKPWPHDGLRHTFATYHVAAYGDVAKTSLIMGHRGSADMIHRHYRGLATKAQGKAFFALVPGEG